MASPGLSRAAQRRQAAPSRRTPRRDRMRGDDSEKTMPDPAPGKDSSIGLPPGFTTQPPVDGRQTGAASINSSLSMVQGPSSGSSQDARNGQGAADLREELQAALLSELLPSDAGKGGSSWHDMVLSSALADGPLSMTRDSSSLQSSTEQVQPRSDRSETARHHSSSNTLSNSGRYDRNHARGSQDRSTNLKLAPVFGNATGQSPRGPLSSVRGGEAFGSGSSQECAQYLASSSSSVPGHESKDREFLAELEQGERSGRRLRTRQTSLGVARETDSAVSSDKELLTPASQLSYNSGASERLSQSLMSEDETADGVRVALGNEYVDLDDHGSGTDDDSDGRHSSHLANLESRLDSILSGASQHSNSRSEILATGSGSACDSPRSTQPDRKTNGASPIDRSAAELAQSLDTALATTAEQQRAHHYSSSMPAREDSDAGSVASAATYGNTAGDGAASLVSGSSRAASSSSSVEEDDFYKEGDPDFAHGCEHSEDHRFGDLLEDFGGYRWPEKDGQEEESDNVRIRPLPFYACLHEMPMTDDDKKGEVFLREWDPTANRYIKKDKAVVPQLYAICLRGPMLSNDGLTPREFVAGVDDSAVENMRRISLSLEMSIREEVISHVDMQEVRINFRVYGRDQASSCLAALEDHILGLYYRNEARRLDNWRSCHRSQPQMDEGPGPNSQDVYGKAKNAAHRLAAEHIFRFYNVGRSSMQIDLHHLRVSNKEAESRLREAMQRVRHLNIKPEESEKYLEVIVGKGLHSKDGKRKLWPEVLRLLRQWQERPLPGMLRAKELLEVNKGALLVRFAEYRGPSPCYGWFYDSEGLSELAGTGSGEHRRESYCKPCLHTWESERVFIDIPRNRRSPSRLWRQRCYECYKRNSFGEVECLQWVKPVKLSLRRPEDRRFCRHVPAYQSENQHRRYASHDPILCELCLFLRRSEPNASCDQLPRFQKRYC